MCLTESNQNRKFQLSLLTSYGNRVAQEDPDIEDEDDGQGKMGGKLEEVRMSNFAYSQTKIAEYLSCYFAMVSILSAGVATEMNFGWNFEGTKEEWIKIMLAVANISTIPLCK